MGRVKQAVGVTKYINALISDVQTGQDYFRPYPVTALENNLETILALALNYKISNSLNPFRATSRAMMVIESALGETTEPRASASGQPAKHWGEQQ